MSDLDAQRDIEAEGQRAAIYHAKKDTGTVERGFTPAAIEALYQRDIQRATDTFNALVEAAEKDRTRRLAYADHGESKEAD